MTYQPPELSEEETHKLSQSILSRVSRTSHRQLVVAMVSVVVENTIQLREINDLRANLGIEPKKGYQP